MPCHGRTRTLGWRHVVDRAGGDWALHGFSPPRPAALCGCPLMSSEPHHLQNCEVARVWPVGRPQTSHEIDASPEALVAPGVPTAILYALLLFGKRKCDLLFACVPHLLSQS